MSERISPAERVERRRDASVPSCRGAIDPFVVMDIMREANGRQAAGDDIIHMEVGQPSTPAPRLVRETVKRAIDCDTLGYTDALGLPMLRERIARHYRDTYGLEIVPSRIVVTTGSSAGFILAFLALLDQGEGLAIPQPGYPCYRQIARVLGLAAISLPARAANGFIPCAQDLRRVCREKDARAVLLASPANPTGTMLPRSTLAAFAQTAQGEGCWLISDEIYHGLTYMGQAETALAFAEHAIIVNSFSKYYSMTGWRIGWMVVPEDLIRTFERLAQNLYISPPAVSQIGALAAFEAIDELEAYKCVYARNRAMLLEELPKAGFGTLAPADGAFYLYADISHLTEDSEAFVRRMLKEVGVAATPGIDFDEDQGRHFMRFSYAGTHEHMREAVRRLRGWVR